MKRGFTLIELLTVMAVSAILLTIISIPMVQSFNLTRAGQGFSDAQERGRFLIDQLTREISNGAGVRDNTGDKGSIVVTLPGRDGKDVNLALNYAKLDILAPSQGDPVRGPNGALRNPDILIDPNGDPNDPNNWKEDPTLRTPRGQVVLPTAAGFKMIRYFIGLREPLVATKNGADANNLADWKPGAYTNPYDGLLMPRSGSRDNLYVLYRAEVELKQFGNQGWASNTDLFGVDKAGQPILDDPAFFNFSLADDTNKYDTSKSKSKSYRILQWMRRARVITEISRYDMVQPIFNKANRAVTYDGNAPRVVPLVQFNPTRISNEPAAGMVAVRSGEVTDTADKFAPDVYRTEFGSWTSTTVRTWPTQFNYANPETVFNPWAPGTPYLIGRARVQAGAKAGASIFAYDGTGQEDQAGTELFDLEEYARARSTEQSAPVPPDVPASLRDTFRYPFNYAIAVANTRAGGTGVNWVNNQALRDLFIGYSVDTRQGKIIASFPITEVGNNPIPAGLQNVVTDNRPLAATGPQVGPTGTPVNDTRWKDDDSRPASFTSQINTRFNKLWDDWDLLMPPQLQGQANKAQLCHRYLDLRVLPLPDGSASPLHPTLGFARTRITPGSEIVFGPDQRPGPNQGRQTRYSRVASPDQVGPNEYFIRYNDIKEPDWEKSYGITGVSTDPRVYDPNSVISAILQAQFRAGYIKFNSRMGEPLPQGNIFVYYRFQFTEPNDVFAIDYDSRQVIDINLTIRNFPQTNLPNPLGVSLKGTATVRNFFR